MVGGATGPAGPTPACCHGGTVSIPCSHGSPLRITTEPRRLRHLEVGSEGGGGVVKNVVLRQNLSDPTGCTILVIRGSRFSQIKERHAVVRLIYKNCFLTF